MSGQKANYTLYPENEFLIHNHIFNFNPITNAPKKPPVQQTLLKNNLYKQNRNEITVQPEPIPFAEIIQYEEIEEEIPTEGLLYYDKSSAKPIISTNLNSSGIYRTTRQELSNKPEDVENVYYSPFPNVGGIVPIVDQQVDGDQLRHKIEILPVPITTVEPAVQSIIIPHNFDQLKYMTGFLLKIPQDGNFSFNGKDSKTIICHNEKSDNKTVFQIIDPETVNLQHSTANTPEIKVQNNKHRRDGKCKEKRLIRPKNEVRNMTEKQTYSRYGRLSKPPKQLKVFINNLKTTEGAPSATATITKESPTEISTNNNAVFSQQINPPSNGTVNGASSGNSDASTNATKKRERRIHNDYRCGTCNRIYLGENKMARHLELNPDHQNKNSSDSENAGTSRYDSKLYKYLMDMVSLSDTNEQRERVFLREISNFVKTLHSLRPTMFHNNNLINGEQLESSKYIDNNIKFLMKLNNHNYSINMSVLNEEVNKFRRNATIHDDLMIAHVGDSISNSNDKITTDYICNLGNENLINLNVDDFVNELKLNTVDDDLGSRSSASIMDPNKILHEVVSAPAILDLTDLFTT